MQCPRCRGTGEVDPASAHFGDFIKERREIAMLTQAELAAKVGISRAQIANLEVGKTDTTVTKLKLIAAALCCNVKDLVP